MEPGKAVLKTQRERAEARRQDKLADVRDQVERGTLTIRKMTAKESAALPPRPRGERPRGARSRWA